MYLTYNEYVAYGGKLSVADFSMYESTAETEIDYRTFNRIKKVGFSNLPDDTKTSIKVCMFQVMKLLQTVDSSISMSGSSGTDNDMKASGVHMMKNDGVEITYNTQSADTVYKNSRELIATTINRMLSGAIYSNNRSLTYRGLYPGE